jgi:two-component system response regulator MprA
MGHTHRILVADDDAMVRMGMRTVLAYQGHFVEEAADGHEAVEKFALQSDRLDLVMLDQNMPGMSGSETLAQLRRLNPSLKAVLLSGGVFEREEAEENDHTRYLPKPFVNEELIEIVGSLLGKSD